MKRKQNKLVISLGILVLKVNLVACQNNTDKSKTTGEFKNSITKEVSSGQIIGKKDKENEVIEWLGIPYAQSPEGDLRWKKPKAIKKWDKPLKVTQYGDVAAQFSNGEVKGSENALNLDVVRPDTKDAKLPVMVYIHGGNNQTGTSQEIKGNSFVNDIKAVYVSVNYRLGALGFNPLEALKNGDKTENSGNYSLLDIAFALDWVHKNIDQFGGDKNNITIAGFSAGGRDVMASLISPVFKGKYNKAISFSGGMTLAEEAESQDIFATAIAPLAVEDKKADNLENAKSWLLSQNEDVSSYLKSIRADRLAPLMGNAGIRMSVFPHLYKDGNVIPKEGFDTTHYNDVPLMLITGTNEFSMFAAFDKAFVKEFSDGSLFKDSEKMKEFNYAKTYGSQLYRLSNGVDSARKLNNNYQSNIFVSEISYGDNKDITPSLTQTLGSFHGIFEPMLQKPSNYKDFIGESFETNGAKEMSENFKLYLRNFLSNGNPNSKKLPQWDAFSNDKVLSIDANKDNVIIQTKNDTETAEDILVKMENDNTLDEAKKQEINSTVLNGRWFSDPIDNQ